MPTPTYRALWTKIVNFLFGLGAAASSLVLIVLIPITISLFLVDSATKLSEIPPAWTTWLLDKVVGFPIPLASYRPLLDSVLLLTGALGVVSTFASTALFRRKLKQRSVVESFPASELELAHKTMREHYLGASELIICSGDFDWIASNEDLRGLLEGLAGQDKLRLFTYKNKEQVREKWENNGDGELFKQFDEHLTEVPNGLPKFSLIKHGSEATFLSYVAVPANREIEATNISVCSLKGPEARNLVTKFDELLQSLITNVGNS